MAHKIAKINVLLKNTVYHYKTYQHLKQNGLNQHVVCIHRFIHN